MASNKLIHVQSQQFSTEELEIIRRTVASKTTPEQFALFIQVCKYSGLNPFARQIYAVVRGNEMTVQTGIDGYRILAERSGKYAGQIGPEWCDESGEWKDVWLSDKPPVAARVGILRRDFEKPIWGVARYKSYEQSSSPMWRKMPEVMLSKCAESLALRKAFPAEMAGIYTDEEMMQADTPHVQASVSIQSETSENVQHIPSIKEIYRLGYQKLWLSSAEFYEIASLELGAVVDKNTPFSPEQKLQLAQLVTDSQAVEGEIIESESEQQQAS